MSYLITQSGIWTGRTEMNHSGSESKYCHEIIEIVDLENISSGRNTCVFLGFKSDEGVRRNQGRTGAKNGPDAIRSSFGRFAVHYDITACRIIDAGNIIVDGEDLETAQVEFGDAIFALLKTSAFPMILGGGHETAFGHYLGIRKFIGDKKLGIINIDAHFDLRSYEKGAHSGSPFRQILDDCQNRGLSFHYLPIGINPAGNQQLLFNVLKDAGQTCILESELNFGDFGELEQRIQSFCEESDFIYLSLDLDVLSSAFAPGVSAPAAFGLDPNMVRQIIKEVFETGKVISMDVVELNPEFDVDGRTAKLAASFIYETITQCIFR